jgi:hypothetical protein
MQRLKITFPCRQQNYSNNNDLNIMIYSSNYSLVHILILRKLSFLIIINFVVSCAYLYFIIKSYPLSFLFLLKTKTLISIISIIE